MSESLGKATLDLEANTAEFKRNMEEAHGSADRMDESLTALAEVSRIAENALHRVKMTSGQAAESDASVSSILDGVHGLSDEARTAARELDHVKLTAAQAAETDMVGDLIDRKLKEIRHNAAETSAALDGMAASAAAGGAAANAASVGGEGGGLASALGPGLIATAALSAPTAGAGAAGLLATLPTLAASGAGALGTLVLAFQGVKSAIEGDKSAFDGLAAPAQKFVEVVRSMKGWLDQLEHVAQSAVFPGLTKGLTAALSPGTMKAVAAAVSEFGTAIGKAGEQWGRYFGSAAFQQIFGPLMRAGAATLGRLSSAALSLFDALGVLGRAAIPLETWLTESAQKGAALLDTWLHAKDASGQLAGAMDSMKTSLQLTGELLAAIARAVGALGAALYPVSQVFVKDLTDGLNALAGIISRNQDAIRTFAGAVVDGLVVAVKAFADGMKLITDALAIFLGQKAKLVVAIAAIGAALLLAMGPGAAAVVGVLFALGEIERHWGAIKSTIGAALTAVKGIVTRGWDAVRSETLTVWNQLKGFLRKWWPELLGALAGPIGILVAYIATHWSQIRSTAVRAFDALLSYIRGIPGKIKAVFAGAGRWLYSIGASLADGLKNGIESRISSVVAAAKHLAGAVKDFLSLHWGSTPFEWAEKKIGHQLTGGIAAGFMADVPRLTAMLEQETVTLTTSVIRAAKNAIEAQFHNTSGAPLGDDWVQAAIDASIANNPNAAGATPYNPITGEGSLFTYTGPPMPSQLPTQVAASADDLFGNVRKPGVIPGFAEGVRNFRGGLALVGENGPELVNLPAGSDVIASASKLPDPPRAATGGTVRRRGLAARPGLSRARHAVTLLLATRPAPTTA